MKYSFKKYQPGSLRLWHWLNALVILGLLGTVLLRKTFLSWRANAQLIESKIVESGGAVTSEAAASVAKHMRNEMWDWHIYLGFALGVLLLSRFILRVVLKRSPAQTAVQGFRYLSQASDKKSALHYTLVQTGYAVFYLATLIMVITGIAMYFKEVLALSKPFNGFIKETHEVMMWFFVLFVAQHIVGVILAENRADSRGLVSDMIHGGDPE